MRAAQGKPNHYASTRTSLQCILKNSLGKTSKKHMKQTLHRRVQMNSIECQNAISYIQRLLFL
ncbi:1000_t:CDS:2 [Cetraspora pellucida]|uniref:1000_t:CDS:1 n=1 Tax=Cetraspora pellucida TaxID=1433469 RepID=A0A9N9ED74_9GLOM|nr:1000_t:CDS:2 [Cetraspora pellucida]